MIRRENFFRFLSTVFITISLTSAAVADACAPEVASVLETQRQSYIAANTDLASQNFSQRPGSFASTTCLDNLMKTGGMDIFFKPPSLDNILSMVKNLACEQASQIFSSIMSGGGINGGGALNPGEILKGIDLGQMVSITPVTSNKGTISSSKILDIFK